MKRWPHQRRIVSGFRCYKNDEKKWERLVKSGATKIWFIQIKRGHNAWESMPGVYVSRTKARAEAIRLSGTEDEPYEARTVRWTSQDRRRHQFDLWWTYINRNNKTEREIPQWRQEWATVYRSLAELKTYLNHLRSPTAASKQARTSRT